MRYEIKVNRLPGLDVDYGSFSEAQMRKFAEQGVEEIIDRNAHGVNVLDQTAKPLSPKYLKRKLKQGGSGIRDLRLTGELLEALAVTEAAQNFSKIAIKGSKAFRKGLFNQNTDPWMGLSDSNQERMHATIQAVFGENVGRVLGGGEE